MNILQSAFWLLYLLLCSLLLQGRTCTLADFLGHIFISIVLLFVRMPSLAFSSATCQEEWGVVLAIWTRSNLITPSALTQATNLVTFKTKINTTGFRNIWNTLLITDHWSDFLDILSECFLRRNGITWCFFAREFVWELWKHIAEQDERKLGWAFGSLRATASDYLSLRERLNFLHNFAFFGSTHFLQIVKLGQFAVCTVSLFAISCKYAIGVPQAILVPDVPGTVPRCSTWKSFVCKLWQCQINSFVNYSNIYRI